MDGRQVSSSRLMLSQVHHAVWGCDGERSGDPSGWGTWEKRDM